jgi:hypothetical protein
MEAQSSSNFSDLNSDPPIAAIAVGALQTSLLAFASHAAAEVIYTPVNVTISGKGSIKINLNHDEDTSARN